MGQRKPTKGAAHFSISEKKEGCAAEIKTKNPNLNKERAIFYFYPPLCSPIAHTNFLRNFTILFIFHSVVLYFYTFISFPLFSAVVVFVLPLLVCL